MHLSTALRANRCEVLLQSEGKLLDRGAYVGLIEDGASQRQKLDNVLALGSASAEPVIPEGRSLEKRDILVETIRDDARKEKLRDESQIKTGLGVGWESICFLLSVGSRLRWQGEVEDAVPNFHRVA